MPELKQICGSFADEKSQKSPQVKTMNAGHFFWAGVNSERVSGT